MVDTRHTPHVAMLRSPLSRARGLGSAHAGSAHWWSQRLTAVALVPLTLWFICGALRMTGATRAEVGAWLSSPLPLVLMLALIAATFYHLQLGVQVVIEDYVHREGTKLAAVLLVKAACVVLALACIVAALKIGL